MDILFADELTPGLRDLLGHVGVGLLIIGGGFVTIKLHRPDAKWLAALHFISRGVVGHATYMTVGLTFIWIGAFLLAGAVEAGYWRSILMQVAVGTALFQAIRASAAHQLSSPWLFTLLWPSGILLAAAGYVSATDYWQGFCVEVGGGILLFAALEMAFERTVLSAMQGDAEARENTCCPWCGSTLPPTSSRRSRSGSPGKG